MSEKSAHLTGRLPGSDQKVRVEITEGVISSMKKIGKSKSNENIKWIAPGFFDNQVNGYMGVDFTEPGLSVDDVIKVTQGLWNTGVTTYLPTIITCDPSILKANCSVLAEAMKDERIGSSIPGIHLEGPYISPEDGFRGAHNRKWVRKPDWKEFMSFYEAAEGHIKQVTLAPEVDGAINFIEKLRGLDIVVALGHHNASSERIKKAADAGATMVTHLGNGCANQIHRHHNPLWPQLAEDRLNVSLIADGFHLTPEEIRTFYKVKGNAGTILISDMTKLAGLAPGSYQWNDKKVILTEDGLITYPDQNVLAGSSLSLKKGVENMMKFGLCELAEVLLMVTWNPAGLNGIYDRGKIEVGRKADLLLFSMDEGEISIKNIIKDGKKVY